MGRASAIAHQPHSEFDLVAIACSAGGLLALSRILSELPADFRAPVAVVMHLSRNGSVLREILQRRTPLVVEWARDRTRLRPGHVYLAPPDEHLLVNEDFRCELSGSVRVCYARPAADVLFTSAAAAFGPRVVGVILSGAGRDGTNGALAIRESGGTVLAQSPASSVMSGMPAAAIDRGGTDLIVHVDNIASALLSLTASRRGKH
jgi:two-component system chemotaxis response regulator CheB